MTSSATIPSNARRIPRFAPTHARRGSIFGLFAAAFPILVILAAFAINSAYIQLSRTQLMVAADAAAHAGGRALSEYQDVEEAKNAAIVTAALNEVAGSPLQLRFDDASNEIEFGYSTQGSNTGYTKFIFNKLDTAQVASGAVRASAVRVNAHRNSGSLSGAVDLFFAGALSRDSFNASQTSVAMQVDRDISLVLDRSGSMDWITWDWPSGYNPWGTSALNAGVSAGVLYKKKGNYYYSSGQNEDTYQTWAWENHFNLGTAPRRPWDDLVSAVDSFLDVLDETPQVELVSVASYSTYGSLDTYLLEDYDDVRDAVDDLYPSGNTAIGRGMQSGIQAFQHSASRPYAAKTMVVMTDGIHNTSTDPVTVANQLKAQYDITIHTVTFGADADISRMSQVATIGGGFHYHAETGDDLIEIFERIANNLSTIITE